MQYTIVTHYKRHEFEAAVEAHLKEGWKLQGGVAVTCDASNTMIMVQAMYREAK